MGFLGNWGYALYRSVQRVFGRVGAGPGLESGSAYELTATFADGTVVPLSTFRGKVALVVNTATGCGFAPQFSELEALSQRFASRGFVVMGFPSNDFLGQEPKADGEMQGFCQLTYNVTFPLFKKGPVGGASVQPVFEYLTSAAPFDGVVLWNFEKFLLDRNGRVIGRWRSAVTPLDSQIVTAVEQALQTSR